MLRRFLDMILPALAGRGAPENDTGPDTITNNGFFVDTNFKAVTAAEHLQRADVSATETVEMTHKKRFDSFDNAQESARKQLVGAYRRAKNEYERLCDAMVRERLMDAPPARLGMLEAVLLEMNEYDEFCLRCFLADDNSGSYLVGFFSQTANGNWCPAFDPINGEVALVSQGKTPQDAAATLRRKLAPYFPPVQEP